MLAGGVLPHLPVIELPVAGMTDVIARPAAQKALEFIGGWKKFTLTPYEDLRFRFKDFREAYIEDQREQHQLLARQVTQVPQLEE